MKKLIVILKYVAPYWIAALLSVISNLLVALFSVISFTMVIPILGLLFSTQQFVSDLLPFKISAQLVQHNFNYYLGQIVENKGHLNALMFIILIVLIFTILKNVFLYISKSLIIHIRTNVVQDIRNELMSKILDFDLSYFSDQRRGDIISKMIVDVKEIEMSIISSLEMIFKDPILITVYLYALFFMSTKLTLIVIIIFPVSALVIGIVGKNLKKDTFRGQERIGALIGMLEEALSGIKIIKAFSAEKFIENRFKDQNTYFSNLFSKVWRRRILINPVMDIIATISILMIVWFGGKIVLSGEGISSQLFIGYLAVFTQVIAPSKSLSSGYYNILKGIASFDRINTILIHQFKIKNEPDAKILENFNKRIEFRNVEFTYENEDESVIKNVNFTIEKGQTVTIVGKSGSGKSTIVDLLPRFFDPDSGNILIDDVPIKNYDINSLRKLIGYVNQEPILFNDTISNNILYGKPSSSKDQLIEVAKKAYAYDFIMEKESGFEYQLGEDGGKLSLGEKQRISIARALLKDSPIMILDEATSALDYNSELIVRKAIKELTQNRTTVIIAHRLSTVRKADKILVLNQGRIVEQGRHEELLELDGYYKELFDLELA